MADIVNQEAVAFCNTRLRPCYDRFSQLYYEAKGIRQSGTRTRSATSSLTTTPGS